jgi:hypothetical protein
MPKSTFTCSKRLFVHLPTHATCRAHFILLDVIIVTIFVEEYKWWNSSLVFLHFPVALCLVGPHVLLKTCRVHSSSDCAIPCLATVLAVETDFKEIKHKVSCDSKLQHLGLSGVVCSRNLNSASIFKTLTMVYGDQDTAWNIKDSAFESWRAHTHARALSLFSPLRKDRLWRPPTPHI